MNILLALLIGFVHGVNEGMDMYKPNVRNHRWFAFYHRLWIVEALLLILFGHRLFLGWWIIPALILGNRFFEMAYGWTRYNKMFPDYENFLGSGIIIMGAPLRMLQVDLLLIGFLIWLV